MGEAILVQELGKRFKRYHADRPVTIMEAVLSGWRRIKPVEHFWALRGINLTVAPGEMLGILGKNGAGKSTLLQLIGGVGRPDEGWVKVRGRIGALLDLGAAFHGDLTGRENVFVSGVIAGLTRREVARRFDAIVEFAELSAFVDNPVRTYSTGMKMRLAFSVAIHTDPEVLLVDEFLSVGDLSFQAKCLERIEQLKNQGSAIVLISHSADRIKQLCDRVLWLHEGRVVAYGDPEVVVGEYIAEMRSQTQQRTAERVARAPRTQGKGKRFGSLEVEISQVRLLPLREMESGDSLRVEIQYQLEQKIDAPIFSVSISRENGQVCFDTNTKVMKLLLPSIEGKGLIALHLDRLDLSGGQYFIDVGVYEQNWTYAYDYHWHLYPLFVRSTVKQKGVLCPPCRWEVGGVPVPNSHKAY